MAVHRRQFLRLSGVAGTVTLAGCTGNGLNTGTPTESTTYQAKLIADDGDSDDLLGTAVALSDDGTTALVSADRDEDPNGEAAGSVYVFEFADGAWSQQHKLAADDGDSKDEFGTSVAISSDGRTALVGASGDEDPNGADAGSAYVFEFADGAWSQQAKLAADDGEGEDFFGAEVALSGDSTTAIVSAPLGDNPGGEDAGAAYVFEFADGAWSQQAKLAADDGDSEDRFSAEVALSADGTTALISADDDEDPNGADAGSAYVFEAIDGTWSQQAKLAADDGDSEDNFGFAVALSADGTTALIGAFWDEDPNGEDAGSVYAFEASDGAWSQQAKLAADDGDSFDVFGRALSVSGDGTTALVGASGDEDPNKGGSAYVFEAAGGSWSQQSKLAADDGEAEDFFGAEVALSDDGTTALIGANGDNNQKGSFAGSAYVFEL